MTRYSYLSTPNKFSTLRHAQSDADSGAPSRVARQKVARSCIFAIRCSSLALTFTLMTIDEVSMRSRHSCSTIRCQRRAYIRVTQSGSKSSVGIGLILFRHSCQNKSQVPHPSCLVSKTRNVSVFAISTLATRSCRYSNSRAAAFRFFQNSFSIRWGLA